ncbi:MAG: hypothetical protein Q7K35_04545 [bacterium]|nr:hypothetical protein [bacterium]
MDKKSKILLAILLIITIAFVSYTFYKTLIQQDFEVVNIEPVEEEEASLDAVGAGDEENSTELNSADTIDPAVEVGAAKTVEDKK